MKEINENAFIIQKEIGETPLEALERFRSGRPDFEGVPMTYAGRLDPMAEGELLILIGDECKKKDQYLGLDKEYEVEIVFGISTDTGDALGLARLNGTHESKMSDPARYVGRFKQSYPAYSSKTVNGKQLHELARAGELPEEMPEKEVEIYSIQIIEKGTIGAAVLKERIFNYINKVKGDFRQESIKKCWNEILNESAQQFEMIKILVKCSSGTYMRSLAERIGKDAGTAAFALSIRRTKIIWPD